MVNLSSEIYLPYHLSSFCNTAVIREYLQRRRTMAPKAKAQLSLELAQEVKDIIALQKLPTAVTPDVFLEAVYLAYQDYEF